MLEIFFSYAIIINNTNYIKNVDEDFSSTILEPLESMRLVQAYARYIMNYTLQSCTLCRFSSVIVI